MDTATHVFEGAFAEQTIQTVDGLRIYARDYAALPPETGLPVVCLHGLTRNSRDFDLVAPRIAALGRRVIVPDMRGRGRSSYDADPAHYVPAIYAQDVLTLLERLAIPEAVFVGTSMGGIITMVIAALAPDRIAAGVLNDVGATLETQGLARIAAHVGRTPALASWHAAIEATRAIQGGSYPTRLDDDAFWSRFAQRTWRELEDGRVAPDYDANIALAFTDPETSPPVDMTPLFELLAKKPVLSVRGVHSDLLSEAGVAHMKAAAPALVTVDVADVGHAPTLEEPEAWEALLDFLARVK